MIVPKSLKIGKHEYTIERVDELPKRRGKIVAGYTNYLQKTIQYVDEGELETTNTIWHEITHAILFEMGNVELNTEHFVSRFANYLSAAINSAKF